MMSAVGEILMDKKMREQLKIAYPLDKKTREQLKMAYDARRREIVARTEKGDSSLLRDIERWCSEGPEGTVNHVSRRKRRRK